MLTTNKLKVLGIDVILEFRDPDDDTQLDESRGYWDDLRQKIVISNKDTEQKNKEVLLHEILHCIESAVATELGEQAVMRFSRALFAVLRDNPEFALWLATDDINMGDKDDTKSRRKNRK